VEKPVETVQKIKAWALPREGQRVTTMHTGIIIEQLIATVARVDEKVEKARKIFVAIPRNPAMPFHEVANLFARPGVM
jgi:hypothetical protein